MADATANDRIQNAIAAATEKIIGAVAAGVGSAAQVGQSTAGALGTVGGSGAQAGLSAQGVSADVQNKADVSAPEVIESMNVHSLKDLGEFNKILVGQQQSNAKLYDVTATALGLAVLGSTHNMQLQQQMATDHRDLAHDRQWNVNETDIYATIAATVTASVLAAMAKVAEVPKAA